MSAHLTYAKASKYDPDVVYAHCSGPGGLKVAEFIADRLNLDPGLRLLDVGTFHGYQSCFLAKEYDVVVVGIDPWVDPSDPEGLLCVEHLARNARALSVDGSVLPVRAGVPETCFADASFDAAYCTTTLEMIRGSEGEARYRACLAEVCRVLRPGGLLGFGEPMHLDVEMPKDLAPVYTKGEGADIEGWAKCFAAIDETTEAFRSVGFEVLEADYAPDAQLWWEEYCQYTPGCKACPDGEEAQTIRSDGGRWLSFGYVIAQKPCPTVARGPRVPREAGGGDDKPAAGLI
ncbi:MAG TPA: class I SAM-dependent methyltransferase [Candidatus Hydrogenedentes bacterium]|nr:class I SAM-dependent methyltransferase [Candidatus Hydrogenedentota bacterium]HIJ74715.1 class I SAM-dependent methyltransferase [Candidatus Hydrogenedentota bacterium]